MAYITSLAYELPLNKIAQKGFAKKVARASNLDASFTAWLERVYAQSAIEARYSVLEEFCYDVEKWNFLKNPSTKARNEQYKLHAPALSEGACKKALKQWGKDPKSITHIIYVSCTGLIAPGPQVYLQQALSLSPYVKQFAITMMGCFGAFKALQLAHAFVEQDPKAVVLAVCTELCSLHYQPLPSHELQIGNALFSDASAACIIEKEKGHLRLVKHESMIVPDTREKMSWDISDNGFLFGLNKDVPELLEKEVKAFCQKLLPADIAIQDCAWPIHPGGKAILHAVEKALSLQPHQTTTSWRVLRDIGNTSSSAFLIVLNYLLQNKPKEKYAVGLGFGPGLTFEGLLLSLD